MLKTITEQILNPSVIFDRRYFPHVLRFAERKPFVRKLLNSYSVEKGKGDSYNVVFIVIDCFRWDHSSMACYERETTPFINEMSKHGLSFTNCYAPSPWTYPSVLSLLSGFYPHRHGGTYTYEPRYFLKGRLPNQPIDEVLILSELLSNLNYHTLFISDIFPAIAAVWNREPRCLYYWKDKFSQLNLFGRRMLDLRNQFFLYLHFGNLHQPLLTPEAFLNIFGEVDVSIPNLNTWSYRSGNIKDLEFPEYRGNRVMLYDAALRFIDYIVENTVSKIEEESAYDTIFVITADHGEEFWEHSCIEKELFYDPRNSWGVDHGHNLFQEIVKVPLVIYGKGAQSTVLNENASLVDVSPTILELLSIKHKIPFDGQSLLTPRNKAHVLSEEVAYGYEKKMVIEGEHKLIVSKGDGISLLFNLKDDPKEASPIDDPQLAERISAWIPSKEAKHGKSQKITSDIEGRLRELGYI